MRKIACVYTGLGALPNIIEEKLKGAVGDCKIHHILDSNLMSDIIAKGCIDDSIEQRLFSLFDAACGTGADLVVCTCSSIGETAEKYMQSHPSANMLRIDYPMAYTSATQCKKVAVLATLETTVMPSCHLIQRLAAENGKEVDVVSSACPGAFEKMIAGDIPGAAAVIVDVAKDLCQGADMIVLAQASMSMFVDALKEALGDVVMLNSPDTCAAYLKETV